MKLRRFLASAAPAAVAVGVTALAPGSALAQDTPAATAVDYVALGDSYSSGLGAGDYDGASGDCKRSDVAYAELWADANAPASFDFTACAGAVTTDVVSDQLGPLDSGTDLVTISIGGNDAGFEDTMITCVFQSTSSCLAAVATANTYITNSLPARLDAVYDAIRAEAPNAHVVVMGYPRMYELDGSCWFGIDEEARAAINGAADNLVGVIADRAADHGFTFADVRPAFTGHEICSDDEWLNSATLPDYTESYPPTAEGQSGGYYAVLEALA
ncbi:SGNH/GDSL hydrolase family protein [Streptomyces specialis]|uniref:SGNH/GDSL hydrolase family protein n=1 Tax=Streptomyces specialis TaxID=498367 RepID=UPI00073E7500|nr:SGNH/GDSL hydrolase family protein [Streptomyces specialis]